MIVEEEQKLGTESMSLEIVWRNPITLVQSQLRGKEAHDPHFGWAEHARKIRARRVS